MLKKVLMSGYNDSGNFPTAAIIPSFSKGLDRDALRKRASIFDNEYDKFERKPNTTYIHLISVAAGEHYGPNSRADFYNGESYEHHIPCPEKGSPSVVVLDGGLNKYHDKEFMAHGAPFTEHFSDQDGAKPQGYIVAAKINKPMHRGELIIGVDSPEWAGDIEKLEKGIPMKFSIGALTASDMCSYCGHVARSEAGHCDHYKNHRGEIDENGNQIYVITDKPMFHDISRVKNPAEKIAFSIKKVASANDDFTLWQAPTPRLDTVRGIIKTASGRKRFDTLAKLAAISKRIMAQTGGLKPSMCTKLVSSFKNSQMDKKACDDALKAFMDYANQDQILCGLKENKRVLGIDEFINLVMPKETQEECHIRDFDIKSALPGIFEDILHSDDVDDFCEDITYCPQCGCSAILRDSIKHSGVGKVEMSDMIGNILTGVLPVLDLQTPGKTVIIKINRSNGSVPDILARHYANYVVSAADELSPEELALTVLKNFV